MSEDSKNHSAEVAAELFQLRARKRELDQAYYVEHTSLVGDEVYDALVRRFEKLERQAGSGEGETAKVGSDLSGDFKSVAHRSRMLSIDNTYSEEGLREFLLDMQEHGGPETSFVVEPKIDGLSLSLWYDGRRLVRAVTRGDGTKGDDVTANVRGLSDIPQDLLRGGFGGEWEVRGEVYLKRSRFAELNSERAGQGLEQMANPRNTASGTLKMKDPDEVRRRGLSYWAYQLVERGAASCTTHTQGLEKLKGWGFPVEPHIRAYKEPEDIVSFVHEFAEQRHELDYDTDGVVVKVDGLKLREDLGSTSKSPRWVIAYKYPAEKAETVLLGVTLQVGRTGVVTPVAELQPVQLGGSVVKRASLHNFTLIREKNLRLGSRVLIQKAGEIIPQVISRVEGDSDSGTREIVPPTDCPSCGRPLSRPGEESPALRCPHLDCPERVRTSTLYFCGKTGMDIEGLGEKVVSQLIAKQLIRRLPDIYRLKREDLEGLEGFAEKSIRQLLEAIEASRSRTYEEVLTSLGISGLGRANARQLCKNFRSMEDLEKAETETLCEVEGIGPILAEHIRAWFAETSHAALWRELRESGLSFESAAQESSGRLKGQRFVITGTLPTLSREEAGRRILAAGGDIASAVSAKTTFLVCGDKPGSKKAKAEKLGVPVIGEDELLKMLAEEPVTSG